MRERHGESNGSEQQRKRISESEIKQTGSWNKSGCQGVHQGLHNRIMKDLAGKQVLVLGLGVSGLAMARWCTRCGARVRVADTRSQPPQLARLYEDCPDAEFVAGAFSAGLLADGIQAVFRSPGLSPVQVRTVVEAARGNGLLETGELGLFARALHYLEMGSGYTPDVLAITGTNGKTTVTALTTTLVRAAGRSVMMAGNIGPTMLDSLMQALDADALPQVWVLELSSFQLSAPGVFAPQAATVLNVSQDHLDWHADMRDYALAKIRIFAPGTVAVINREDEQLRAYFDMYVSALIPDERPRVVTFACNRPQQAGDFGVVNTDGTDWLVRLPEAMDTSRKAQEEVRHCAVQTMMPAAALQLIGRHNVGNVLAALALCSAVGLPLAPMLSALREYRGEPHRLQSCAVVQGREFVDDSKATNVGATLSALMSLGDDAHRLVLLLGGDGKGQDFSPLQTMVRQYVRAVVLMGRDAPVIGKVLQESLSDMVPMHYAADMQEAVTAAYGLSQPGDVVLLSPACSSLDQYDNYAHRGAAFLHAIERLRSDAGMAEGGAA